MYIESRFFDDGEAEIRIIDEYNKAERYLDKAIYYVDEVTDLDEWFNEYLSADVDYSDFEGRLQSGEWVDISNYI